MAEQMALITAMSDWYWLVGLLEGEGSFTAGPPSYPSQCRVFVEMRDEDVIRRAAAIIQTDRVRRIPKRFTGRSDTYCVDIRSRPAVQIMERIRPVMSMRRQSQIDRAVACWHGQRESVELLSGLNDGGEAEQLAWLTGLLEGEGTFLVGIPSEPNRPRIQLQMCDLDVVERVAIQFRVSWQEGKPPNDRSRVPYITMLRGKRAVALMQQLYPHMGQRRQQQIDRVLAHYDPQLAVRALRRADLEESGVLDIYRRACAGEPYAQIAGEYGIKPYQVRDIKRGVSWGWLTGAGR